MCGMGARLDPPTDAEPTALGGAPSEGFVGLSRPQFGVNRCFGSYPLIGWCNIRLWP